MDPEVNSHRSELTSPESLSVSMSTLKNTLHCIRHVVKKPKYEGVDFEHDLVALYRDIRTAIASEGYNGFGPSKVTVMKTDNMTDIERLAYQRKVAAQEKAIKEGYGRIKTKVKEIRRKYRTAVDEGTISGAGRVVQAHFQEFHLLWKGCPTVTRKRDDRDCGKGAGAEKKIFRSSKKINRNNGRVHEINGRIGERCRRKYQGRFVDSCICIEPDSYATIGTEKRFSLPTITTIIPWKQRVQQRTNIKHLNIFVSLSLIPESLKCLV